jgi:hypothetical protein
LRSWKDRAILAEAELKTANEQITKLTREKREAILLVNGAYAHTMTTRVWHDRAKALLEAT